MAILLLLSAMLNVTLFLCYWTEREGRKFWEGMAGHHSKWSKIWRERYLESIEQMGEWVRQDKMRIWGHRAN